MYAGSQLCNKLNVLVSSVLVLFYVFGAFTFLVCVFVVLGFVVLGAADECDR